MTDAITADELAYLKTLEEQERNTLAALRATRQSYETHLAGKYKLAQGDQIDGDGAIVRKTTPVVN